MRGRAVAASLLVAATAVVTGCGGREVTFPDPAAVEAPPFATTPEDLADSPQLDAVPERDTAGLVTDSASASATLLPEALAMAAALDPPPTRFTRISIYDRNVLMTWKDPTVPGRAVTGSLYDDGTFYVSEPSFDEEEGYSIEGLDPTVPAALVEAIESRFPLARVTDIDLRLGLSYGFDLVWNVQLTDARGTLATIYADLDGTIIAVDAS